MSLTHFREVLRYVPNFRGETFVVAVDGEVVADGNFTNLILDIAVLRSLSINVILAHGIDAQLRERAGEAGVTLTSDDGSGVTDDSTMRIALTTAGETTQRILGAFQVASLPAVAPNCVSARPAGVIEGIDRQHTGKVLRIDGELIGSLLSRQIIPIISPLGYDHDGSPLRLKSDAIAIAVARAVRAKKVIFAGASDGVVVDGELVRQLAFPHAERLCETHQFDKRIASKLSHAVRACRKGIERVHLINGTTEEGLLAEVFSNEGIGTLVYSDDHYVIRSATAEDVPAVQSLVHEAAAEDEVIARTRNEIADTIDAHFVVEVDGNVVACAAMYEYAETGKAELASLAVSDGHKNVGLASRLIAHIEQEAGKRNIGCLFCLSTQAFSFFKRKASFQDGTPDDLPEARRQRWAANGRNSRVLVKQLG